MVFGNSLSCLTLLTPVSLVISAPIVLERACMPDCLQAKALTIDKLMQIAPAGTVDPTPFIYDSTMYTMAGLMVSFGTMKLFLAKNRLV